MTLLISFFPLAYCRWYISHTKYVNQLFIGKASGQQQAICFGEIKKYMQIGLGGVRAPNPLSCSRVNYVLIVEATFLSTSHVPVTGGKHLTHILSLHPHSHPTRQSRWGSWASARSTLHRNWSGPKRGERSRCFRAEGTLSNTMHTAASSPSLGFLKFSDEILVSWQDWSSCDTKTLCTSHSQRWTWLENKKLCLDSGNFETKLCTMTQKELGVMLPLCFTNFCSPSRCLPTHTHPQDFVSQILNILQTDLFPSNRVIHLIFYLENALKKSVVSCSLLLSGIIQEI